MIDWEEYKNFTEEEFACKGKNCCGGEAKMMPSFMHQLQQLRNMVGPLTVNSGYRCSKYDKEVGGANVHPQGVAVDLGVSGSKADKVEALRRTLGFTGKGSRQHGPHSKRFIHLDMVDDMDHPRPASWTYR